MYIPSDLPESSQLESAIVTRSRGCPRCVWMPVLIDGSACLVEPSCFFPVPVQPAPSMSGAASPVAAHECPSRGLVEGLVAPPSCFFRAALSFPSLERCCVEHPLLEGSSLYVILDSCSPGRHIACAAQAFMLDRHSSLILGLPVCEITRCSSVLCHLVLVLSSRCQWRAGVELGTSSWCNSRLLSSRQLDLVMNCIFSSRRTVVSAT